MFVYIVQHYSVFFSIIFIKVLNEIPNYANIPRGQNEGTKYA